MHAGAVVRLPVLDYLPTDNYAMFEIKTLHYQKVILDCQGFIHGLYFYNSDKYERQISMDEESCDSFHQFLTDAKTNHKPVCLELDTALNSVDVTDKSADCK